MIYSIIKLSKNKMNNNNNNNDDNNYVFKQLNKKFVSISNDISKKISELTKSNEKNRKDGIHIDPHFYNFNDDFDSNFEDDLYDQYEKYDKNDFSVNEDISNGVFTSKLYADVKINKKIMQSSNDDTIIIPPIESQKLLLQDNHILEITNENTKLSVYAKVIDYCAPNRNILIPKWMMEKIGAKTNDLLKLEIAKIKKITMVRVVVPSLITNSLGIMEFHLKDRNLLYSGEEIKIKMFEMEFVFKIEEIYNDKEKLNVGMLYDILGDNSKTEINFDIIVE